MQKFGKCASPCMNMGAIRANLYDPWQEKMSVFEKGYPMVSPIPIR